MFLTSFLFKKKCLYSALVILLALNFIFLSLVYFYFLKEITHKIDKSVDLNFLKIPVLIPAAISNNQSLVPENGRSFIIDYEHDQFLKDGKPFRYISGSLHYFRVPRVYWRDRLRKFRAAGLNAVCTYVEWSSHEPSPGNYMFDGELDLEYFLKLAEEEDLFVLLRPGPYICAERDFGGLPPWLMTLHPNIELRTNDPDYQNEVNKWFDVLLSRIQKYLYGNGGRIITVQIENEYGSYGVCNMEHKIWLRDLMRSYIKNNAVLFTTDGNAEYLLKCGAIPNVYASIDFGTTANVNASFEIMRTIESKGPLINSEFYPGWLSHWEEEMQTISTAAILNPLKEMLFLNVNINFYMFYGGTNFGFMNGANLDSTNFYQPQLTSYDYDAPLDESGDPTEKYFAIRQFLSQYVEIPNITVPTVTPKGDYGILKLRPVLSLFDFDSIPNTIKTVSKNPKTFEELNVSYGYVLYETTIPENISDPAVLFVTDIRDRAIVYVKRIAVGILSRARRIYGMPLISPPGETLSLLVENQGRVNFGRFLKDQKGISNSVLLDNRQLYNWTMIGFPLENVSWVQNSTTNHSVVPPAFYTGEFVLPEHLDTPLDTFVDLTGWGKGVIWVNNFNLGRYWPSVGSQVTLYVPGSCLKPAPFLNTVVVFETEYTDEHYTITFRNTAILRKIPPNNKRL